jgi:tRNA threonylcarbamoyladenosine biosynthesis protein TsaB
MLILALDTTTRAGSIAVLRGPAVLYEAAGDPSRTYGERLPTDVQRALEAAGVPLGDVELYAVAAGPGSFTGLRIGIATVQAIAVATGRRVVPVSALDAAAQSAAGTTGPVGAWMDAQRGEVFGALYGPTGRDLVIPPVSATPAALLRGWQSSDNLAGARFVGDGAVRYQEVITSTLGPTATVLPGAPLAGAIGRIAAGAPHLAVVPHAIVPIYVRQSDAELARARRQESR